jgi:exonuclease SbcC
LARRLVSGDACSVCGSTDHPEPARGEQEPVTPHDLEVARDGVTDRQGQLATAQKNVQSVDLNLAEARALAGAAELSEHLATRDAATKTYERSSEALALLPRLEEQLAQRRNDITEQTAQLESARNDVDSAAAEHAASTARRATIAKKLVTQRGPFTSVHERVTGLKAQLRVTRAVVAALYARNQRLAEYDSCLSSLQAHLREHGFDTATAAQAARIESSEVTLRVHALRLHDDAVAAARATLADPELASLPEDLVDLEPSQVAVGTASARRDDALTRHSSLLDRTRTLDGIVSRVTTLFAAAGSLHTTYQQVRELADVVHGDEPNTKRMRLENYVLAAQLEQIVHAANVRLGTMTSGRYALEHDDSLAFGGARSGLGLLIRDEYTGRARATHSLSGGETFLASLALALGLAEVVTAQAGGVTLDTLFVDEGFGSLDGETLETAMSTLDSLRAGGRTIGLISHVDSMKEQIPATLRIDVTDRGFSRINADRSDE